MVIAVYPGTFDPFTKGHEEIVRRAAQLFDQLLVAVASAVHKQPLFNLEERLGIAAEVCAVYANVRVHSFTGLLSHFAHEQRANVIVRGLRAVSDFDFEFQMAGMNRILMPDVETLFLAPSDQYQFVSATFVREIALLGGDVSRFVSPAVTRRLAER